MQHRNASEDELKSQNIDPEKPEDSKITYYEDPHSKYANLTDLTTIYTSETHLNYSILEYGTLIRKNNFKHNFAGKKGTAIHLEGISELVVEDNTFLENGPVTLQKEIEFSPYYKYMLNS